MDSLLNIYSRYVSPADIGRRGRLGRKLDTCIDTKLDIHVHIDVYMHTSQQ